MKQKQVDKLPFPKEQVEKLIADIRLILLSKIPAFKQGKVKVRWSGYANSILLEGKNLKEEIRGSTFTLGIDPFMYLSHYDTRGNDFKLIKIMEVNDDSLIKLFKFLEVYRCFEIEFDVKTNDFTFKEIIHTPKTEPRSKTGIIWHTEEEKLKMYFESWIRTLPVLFRGEMKIWWNNKTGWLNFNLRTKKNHLRWSSDGKTIRWVILSEEGEGQFSITHFSETQPAEELGMLIMSFGECKSFKLFYNFNGTYSCPQEHVG